MSLPVTTSAQEAARIVREGRVAAFPAGTSYGLAADPLQGFALQRLRNLKNRPDEKSFTVALHEDLWEQYLQLSPVEKDFLNQHKNSPLTLLVQPREALRHLTLEGRLGLRVIDHPLMAALALALNGPFTATSANRSGEEPCLNPACIAAQFPEKIDETTYNLSLGCILDGGELPTSLPSTIIRIDNNLPVVIRPGALASPFS